MTLWRWAQALSAAGVSALVPHRKGPRRASKLTPEVTATIAVLREQGLSLRAIGERVAVSEASVRRALSDTDTDTDTDDPTTVSDETEVEAETETDDPTTVSDADPRPRPRPRPRQGRDPSRRSGPTGGRAGAGIVPGCRCRCWPIRSIAAASGRWRRSG